MSLICNARALKLQHIFGQHYGKLIPYSSFETVFTISVWRTDWHVSRTAIPVAGILAIIRARLIISI